MATIVGALNTATNADEQWEDTSGMPCIASIGGRGWFRNTKKGPWDATTGCAEWQRFQWEASFKDVPFAVDNDVRTGGRRIHVHEYPSREVWDNEDLGRLRQQINVEGYVYGDQHDLWAEQLFAACTSPLSAKSTTGAGILYLPMRVPLWAVCQSVESSFNAERMGRIDFNMQFSIEPNEDRITGVIVGGPGRRTPVQMAHSTFNMARQLNQASLQVFDRNFTGTQPSVARQAAGEIIRATGRVLRNTAAAVRLNNTAGSVVEFIASRFIEHWAEYADVQRTSINTMNRTAAVISQRTSGLSLYQQAMAGVALRSSTGEVLPATGSMAEGFGGMLWNALSTLRSGGPLTSDNSSDLAQALIPLTHIKPQTTALSASQLATASVQAEIQLAETVCAVVRRLALSYSVMAGVTVAPAKQPDASLTRTRLLEQIDEEIELLAGASGIQGAMRRLRSSVVSFVNHYSTNGGASVNVPESWQGQPLAVIAATLYGQTAEGRDVDLMRFNGVSHPMFAPNQLVALNDGNLSMMTGL